MQNCPANRPQLALSNGGKSCLCSDAELQTVSDVREFFREALATALEQQHLQVKDHTEHYVVNLLAMFARTEALFEPGPDGAQLKPLALLLAEALEARDDGQPLPDAAAPRRRRAVRLRLPRAAASRAGWWTSITTSRWAAAPTARSRRLRARGPRRVLATVFAELEDKFQPLVDALNDISDSAAKHSQRDVLRLYELWHRTGSRRAHRLLMRLGIQPVASGALAH